MRPYHLLADSLWRPQKMTLPLTVGIAAYGGTATLYADHVHAPTTCVLHVSAQHELRCCNHPALATGGSVQARYWHFLLSCRNMHERAILAAGKRISHADVPTVAD